MVTPFAVTMTPPGYALNGYVTVVPGAAQLMTAICWAALSPTLIAVALAVSENEPVASPHQGVKSTRPLTCDAGLQAVPHQLFSASTVAPALVLLTPYVGLPARLFRLALAVASAPSTRMPVASVSMVLFWMLA